MSSTAALGRSLSRIALGTAERRAQRTRLLHAGRQSERYEQVKIPVSGNAPAIPLVSTQQISFEAPFLWAPRQRDVPFARPHFVSGAELTAPEGPVIVRAHVLQWNVNDQGWVVGAQVQIATFAPGAVGAVTLPYSGVLHLRFQGYAAQREQPGESNNTVPPGIAGHWDASALVGYADGAPVPTLPDSSGNGHDLVQPDATQQPVFSSAVTNGLPGLRFFSNFLDPSTTSRELLLGDGFHLDPPFAYFLVMLPVAVGSGPGWQNLGADDGNDGPYLNPSGHFEWYPLHSSAAVVPAGAAVLFSVVADSSGYSFWRNGAPDDSGSSAAAETWAMTSFGNDPFSEGFDGYLHELVAYSGAMPGSTRTPIEAGLMTKWGL